MGRIRQQGPQPMIRDAANAAQAAKAGPAVSVRGVDMDFGAGPLAVADAGFDLARGRFLTILGPSGSGKTTLLRMIAGFQTPTRGEIFINGEPVSKVAPHQRAIGMVFQKLALFPHLTAAQNVAFPLKMRRFDARGIPARVEQFLDLVRLGGLGGRRIHELSGGQQQRVAIARALVFQPDLLLLDEPLAALDRKLREEMQLEFRRIQRELGVTTINVTHDQREALVMSDEVIVMEAGRIQQNARPVDLYRDPANAFVANFIGVTSFLPGRVAPGGLECGGILCPGTPRQALAAGTPARGAIRAEQIRMAADGAALAGLDFRLQGQVRDAIFEGERQLYEVVLPALGGIAVQVYHHDASDFALTAPGQTVTVGWNRRDMILFPAAVP
ncbi:ABC transporter ATP-binding protein [Rhodobacter ferrooxidans]|uniref:ABC transporter related protein n=1 Tax=Rhodobacter ferrooxidans TaxID=371731 RepID=C8RZG1_9RHOB|nr:ABC transporter ATP-binding protein [Rhodobacter sp. SW2]EEW25758.1 ABC transporter related protein [Rhodobacter sp. SW2]